MLRGGKDTYVLGPLTEEVNCHYAKYLVPKVKFCKRHIATNPIVIIPSGYFSTLHYTPMFSVLHLASAAADIFD